MLIQCTLLYLLSVHTLALHIGVKSKSSVLYSITQFNLSGSEWSFLVENCLFCHFRIVSAVKITCLIIVLYPAKFKEHNVILRNNLLKQLGCML